MEICVKGILMECISKKSKDGSKMYFTLCIYSGGKLYNVGVPQRIFQDYLASKGDEIVLTDVNLWVNGSYNLYVKDDLIG